MSLLSSFIVTHVVNALEKQFLSHVPELQQAFLNEVASLVKVVSDWVESKMNVQGGSTDEEKSS
jgi:hypothetical protein